jgi:hypothetical protein
MSSVFGPFQQLSRTKNSAWWCRSAFFLKISGWMEEWKLTP